MEPSHEMGNTEKPLPSPGLGERLALYPTLTQTTANRWMQTHFPNWARLQGWRRTVRAGAAVAVVVIVVNILTLAWALTRSVDPNTGQRIVFQGDCNTMAKVSTSWHLVINVFSTLLLATANTTMQCLSAPTREEVDRAHAQGTWVDIGISSLRNWRYMGLWRKWCWIYLLLSTLPLHLFYNSVIFTTNIANEYWAVVVAPDFLQGAPFSIPDQTHYLSTYMDNQQNELSTSMLSYLSSPTVNRSLVRLENSQCISTYRQTMLNRFSNVLLVAKSDVISSNSSVLRYYYHAPIPGDTVVTYGSNWICGEPDSPGSSGSNCNFDYFLQNAESWNSTSAMSDTGRDSVPMWWAPPINIDYCLAQPVSPVCSVQFIPNVMIYVIVANSIMILCFLWALYTTSFNPLVTLGDGLASFLSHPDPHTKHLGPISAEQIRGALKRARNRNTNRMIRKHSSRLDGTWPSMLYSSQNESPLVLHNKRPDPFPGLPLELGPWKPTQRRWFSGVSGRRWALTYTLICTLWVGGFILLLCLVESDPDLYADFAAQESTGFGNASPGFLWDTNAEKSFGATILVNLPQIALSSAYLSLNGLYTGITLSREFTMLAQRRAGLRVTEPKGRYQKSTYWLSLPYRFSLPLIGLSWLLHWALSQTLFLAEVEITSPTGENDSSQFVSSQGFSTLGLLILLIISAIAIIMPLLLGWFHYFQGAPLVESYSLAISAACHPCPGTSDPASQLLMYGGMESGMENSGEEFETIATDRPARYRYWANRWGASTAPMLTSPRPSPSQETGTEDQDATMPPLETFSPEFSPLLRPPNDQSLSRSLSRALSPTAVMPLAPNHTYTPLRTFTATELASFMIDFDPNPRLRRWLRWLRRLLLIGAILKLALVIMIFLVGGMSQLEVSIPAGLTTVYVITRAGVHMLSLRRKTPPQKRYWWWHVVPEMVLASLWLNGTAQLAIYPSQDAQLLSALAAAQCALFAIDGTAEFWLWSYFNPGKFVSFFKRLPLGKGLLAR